MLKEMFCIMPSLMFGLFGVQMGIDTNASSSRTAHPPPQAPAGFAEHEHGFSYNGLRVTCPDISIIEADDACSGQVHARVG